MKELIVAMSVKWKNMVFHHLMHFYRLYHGDSKEKEKQLWITAVFEQLVFSTREL